MRNLSKLILVLTLSALVLMFFNSANSAPYCLLQKPETPPRNNCFQFYLADTAKTAAQGQMATIAGGACVVTPFASRQGWVVNIPFGGPYRDWATGDVAMSIVSPYHDDFYGCNNGNGGTRSTNGGLSGASSANDPIVGCWKWFNNNNAIFDSKGNIYTNVVTPEPTGTWTSLADNKYEIKWPGSKYVDTLFIKNKELWGHNNVGRGSDANPAYFAKWVGDDC